MNTETKIRTELFTQVTIDGVEKPPICVFLDDGTTIPVAFDRLQQAYSTLYSDHDWLPQLVHEFPACADVLQETCPTKIKTDITPRLTLAYYVQTRPMTRFI